MQFNKFLNAKMTPLVEEIDVEVLRKAALQACGLLKILGNPDRLLLLCQMTQGEYCVSELEQLTGILLRAATKWRQCCGSRTPVLMSNTLFQRS